MKIELHHDDLPDGLDLGSVVAIDTEKNLILVKGSVPGPNNACVFVRPAVRLNRKKTTAAGKKK